MQLPTSASRNVVAVNWQAFVHEIEHYVDPRLDLISAPYGKWDKGKTLARQYHQISRLQNPNVNGAREGRTGTSHGNAAEPMSS